MQPMPRIKSIFVSVLSIGMLIAPIFGEGQSFIYLVSNSNPLGTGSVIVLDEDTLLPIAGSPFTTIVGAAGEQVQIAIRPSISSI